MGKVVKLVASVATLALAVAVPGLGALVLPSLLTALSVGTSLLAKKPRAPANSRENLDRLRASIDVRTPRKTVIGRTAMATDIRDEEFTGAQEYLHRFIVVASHKVHAISEIWFDDKLAWTVAGGVQGEYVGYLTVAPVLEGNAGNAINISARMGSSRRYTGCAYVHLSYKLTGNSKKTDSPFAQGITSRITIRGDGAYFYDPRLDSTVPGGSGTQRADDQATWIWDNNACRNPALALLFYLLGWRITNPDTSEAMLAVGKGIPPQRIDLESFAVAANICDELVSKVGGGTEPRYRCDGVWSEGDSPTTVIDMLKATMNADLDDVDGKLRLTVFYNDLAVPAATFTEDDVLDEFEWRQTPSLDQSFNVVRGTYTDPSDNALYQPVDYPQASIDGPDGINRIDSFDLPMVQSAGQAQRLAWLRLNRQSYAGEFETVMQPTAWAVQKNDVIEFDFAPTGFTGNLFRVAEMELRTDGTVPIRFREENAAIYAAPTVVAAVEAVASTPYDAALNPIVGALADFENALITSSWVTDLDPLDGLLEASPTQIVVETHTRTYNDKAVSVTGATLTTEADGVTAIVASVTYHVYYDDAGRAGGGVALKATQDAQAATNSPANPARHYVGSITTPTSGTVTGGGALPPGWDFNFWYF